nr:uncharacterized protein LOC112010965 [Quercus suber]
MGLWDNKMHSLLVDLDLGKRLGAKIVILKIAEIIEKALKNATYTSPRIQKEILHVFSAKVKKAIREEIGDAKFCIMVDETRDESMKEQMAMGIYSLLSQHCFDIQNIRGQRYDGASNMRGMWSELQALILNDCPYAYYIHCFAHRLQLALRNEQLKVVNANEIARLINLEELETGNGLNQIGTLQRPVETKAESAYDGLTSFEFVFILHLEKETIKITDKLCQALQSQSQDILNAMHLVSSTKALSQKFRDDGWDGLLTTVISFCEKHYIDVIGMNARYVARRGRTHAMELLRLSSALEPREALKSFRSSDLYLLVKNFYPQDFTDYDKQVLEKELYHFEHNVVQDQEFKKLKSLYELSQWLVKTGNSEYYKLVYRLVRLVLTLPVSTATTEQAFSVMKIVKTNLRNKMENDFLTDSLMFYIKKDIALTFSLDSIIDNFEDLKERRVSFS